MDKTKLIYRTPIRKAIEGCTLFFLGVFLLFYWYGFVNSFAFKAGALFVISLFILFFGLHRALSFQIAHFERGSKQLVISNFILGFIRRKRIYDVGYITFYASDLYFFTWAVFAYQENKHPREVFPEKRRTIIDCISRKKARAICEQITSLCPIKYRSPKK